MYRELDGHDEKTMGNVDEDKLVNKEKNILEIARESWRMHNVSALEIFADIQHHGGVTRLLDVTLNPYVATWFAVESDKHEGYDARIFAISKNSENADPQTIENLKITDKDLRVKTLSGMRGVVKIVNCITGVLEMEGVYGFLQPIITGY